MNKEYTGTYGQLVSRKPWYQSTTKNLAVKSRHQVVEVTLLKSLTREQRYQQQEEVNEAREKLK